MPYVYLALLSAALVAIQCMVGGTRLLFSLPAYGLLALAAALSVSSFRRPGTVPRRACLIGAGLCFSYLLIRAVCSPIAYLARLDIYSIIGCVTVYLLVTIYLTRTWHRVAIVGVMIAIAGVEVAVGLVQFQRDANFMLFGFQRGPSGSWASGMFVSHNHLAGYLEMVGAMALSLALWSKTKPSVRILVGYLAVVCYGGVAIAGSRGGYLSTVASLVVFGALSICIASVTGRDKAILGTIGTAVVLALAGTIAVRAMWDSSQLSEKLQKLIVADVRTSLREAAWDQFRTSPTIGTGAGTHLYYGRLFRRPEVESDPVHPHNDYLELLAEYGVVGAIGMFALLLTHVVTGWCTASGLARGFIATHEHGSTELALQIGALSGIAAILAHSVVDFNLHIPGNALVCAFLFAILASPGSDKTAVLESPPAWTRGFRLALPALGLWLLVMGLIQTFHAWRSGLPLTARGAWTLAMVLPSFPGEYHAEEARIALRDGRYEQAAALAETGIRYETKNPNLYFYLGEANRALALRLIRPALQNLKAARFDAAIKAYRSGLALFPQDIQLLLRLGQCLDAQKKFDEAEPVYLEAWKNDPNLSFVHLMYGVHLEKAGRADEAEEAYRRGRELAHHNIEPFLRELRNP